MESDWNEWNNEKNERGPDIIEPLRAYRSYVRRVVCQHSTHRYMTGTHWHTGNPDTLRTECRHGTTCLCAERADRHFKPWVFYFNRNHMYNKLFIFPTLVRNLASLFYKDYLILACSHVLMWIHPKQHFSTCGSPLDTRSSCRPCCETSITQLQKVHNS